MRKALIGLLAVALLLFGSTAYANGNHDKGKKYGHDDIKACNDVVKGLENALSKAKNDKAKKAIRKAIDDVKKRCAKIDPQPAKPLTDVQRVAADKAALSIGYADGDNASRVTKSISLPTRGQNGSTIAWTSGSPSLIGNDGKLVARPADSTGDIAVVMFAVIKYNNTLDYKTFQIVIKQQQNDAERVAADKAALQIKFNGSDNGSSVTQAVQLATTGPNGSSIKWTSSNAAVISNDGKTVNRPAYGSGDAVVVLTAVIQYGAAVDMKVFTVTVKQQYGDANAVAADKAALEIKFAGLDTATSVTRPIELQSKGAYGSTIAWTSSNTGVISHDGKTVKRPARGSGDAIVVMTATLTSGAASDIKVFVLTVKQQYNDEETVAADKAELTVGYSGTDNASSVTGNVKLINQGHYGSDIVWVSSHPSVISSVGTVVRPALATGDVKVELTAVIVYNGRADYKTFTLTVKAK